MIGKSLKARRQNEAIGKLFDEAGMEFSYLQTHCSIFFDRKFRISAVNVPIYHVKTFLGIETLKIRMLRECEKPIPDKNGNGRISVREYVKIFSEHGIAVAEDEVRKISELANENGDVTKDDFLHYAKTSDFFRSQENHYPTFPNTYNILNVKSRILRFLRKIGVKFDLTENYLQMINPELQL